MLQQQQQQKEQKENSNECSSHGVTLDHLKKKDCITHKQLFDAVYAHLTTYVVSNEIIINSLQL